MGVAFSDEWRAVLSPGVPTILSRFARLVGTPGYSKVSLSAEINLITKEAPFLTPAIIVLDITTWQKRGYR